MEYIHRSKWRLRHQKSIFAPKSIISQLQDHRRAIFFAKKVAEQKSDQILKCTSTNKLRTQQFFCPEQKKR
jgi:hypothetical protein